MTRLWRGSAVACLAGATLQSSLALSIVVKGIRVALQSGLHLPVLRDGSTMLLLVGLVSIPGVLFGLRAHLRLRESSPRFAELAGAATLFLLGTAVVLVGLSASPLVELH